MDLGVTMGPEVLEDKLEEARERRRKELTWNTRNLPKRLTPGWTNRLWVACGRRWVGWFPLAGEVLWNPEDARAPYGLIFDPRRWTPIPPAPAPRFRGWRYLEPAPLAALLPAAVPTAAASAPTRGSISSRTT